MSRRPARADRRRELSGSVGLSPQRHRRRAGLDVRVGLR